MIRFSKKQVLHMHYDLIEATGGSHGLRDDGLLDSALNTPFQSFDGVDMYPSIQQKCARLGYGLIQDHPFVDGNKRIGAHAMLVQLAINGIELTYTQEELEEMILSVAAGKLTFAGMVRWIIDRQI